jgi:hypothetical protein
LFAGTLIAAVQAGDTEERPLAAAEMAVLYGGAEQDESCCFDFGICDATFPTADCTHQGNCVGYDVLYGNELNCLKYGIAGDICEDKQPPTLCKAYHPCRIDYPTYVCKEVGGPGTLSSNTVCYDNCP